MPKKDLGYALKHGLPKPLEEEHLDNIRQRSEHGYQDNITQACWDIMQLLEHVDAQHNEGEDLKSELALVSRAASWKDEENGPRN